MHIHNHVEPIAQAVYAAIYDSSIFPDIEYERQPYEMAKGVNKIKKRRPYNHEITCFHFPQTWGSGALGFGGMGTASMCTAYTSVIILGELAAIFFGGRHCYTVPATGKLFKEHLQNRMMLHFNEHDKYEEE